jgi:hypothetical protein
LPGPIRPSGSRSIRTLREGSDLAEGFGILLNPDVYGYDDPATAAPSIQIFIRCGFLPGKEGGYCRRRELHGRDASCPLLQGKNPCL